MFVCVPGLGVAQEDVEAASTWSLERPMPVVSVGSGALEVNAAAARKSDFGLESTYTADTTPVYLRNKRPRHTRSLHVSFFLKASKSFKMKKEQETYVFSAVQGKKKKVFRLALVGRKGVTKVGVRLDAKTVAGWRKVGERVIKRKKWYRIQVKWLGAASETSSDGVARLGVGKKKVKFKRRHAARSLANPYVVDQVQLGQVGRKDPATVGSIYFDEFEIWTGRGN